VGGGRREARAHTQIEKLTLTELKKHLRAFYYKIPTFQSGNGKFTSIFDKFRSWVKLFSFASDNK
jgi:hypothetical protein